MQRAAALCRGLHLWLRLPGAVHVLIIWPWFSKVQIQSEHSLSTCCMLCAVLTANDWNWGCTSLTEQKSLTAS